MTNRTECISAATDQYDNGAFLELMRRRVACRSVSQGAADVADLRAYLDREIVPWATALGFESRILDNAVEGYGPFLIATRSEGADLPTVLLYGHGDTVLGDDARWRSGLSPWTVTVEGDRWYGRGTADNKGQHAINLVALQTVLEARGGRLGFNVKILIEMGEETGSTGLNELCAAARGDLSADLLIASDGPRVSAERPTVFLGSRGSAAFELEVALREGAHHSGNWGGLLRNPGTILAHAIATLVDLRGRITVDRLRTPPIPEAVRTALLDLKVGGGPGDPAIDDAWGEPGRSNEERVFASNTLEVLAFRTGDPDGPQNAVPAHAKATMQLRFVVGTDWRNLVPAIRAHLDSHGMDMVTVRPAPGAVLAATRLDPTDPWVAWALASIARSTGKTPALLPNLGGTIPNAVFAEDIGMPTLWVPHSYPACSQHAPDEHMLGSIAREGLAMMAGLFWDLGEQGVAIRDAHRRR